MAILNVEIKAKTSNQAEIRNILKENKAEYKDTDYQVDTYFNVKNGRLKLREGKLENNLIYYIRENKKGPKQSKIILYKSEPDSTLKELLSIANGVLTVIDKEREIYFIKNVKFHIDTVKELGSFIEIEAIDKDGSIGKEKLLMQCEYYLNLFNIPKENLIAESYSDLVLNARQK